MNCDSIKELLSAYVDGEVTCEEEQECLKHVEICDDCRETLSMFIEIKNNIDVVDNIDLPNGFHEDLMGRIKQEATVKIDEKNDHAGQNVTPFTKPSKYKWMGYIASVAAVFAGAMIIVGPKEDTVQTEQLQQERSVKGVVESVPKAAREEMDVSPMTLTPETTRQQQEHLQVKVSDLEQGVEEIKAWAKEHKVQVTLQQNEEEAMIDLVQVVDYDEFKNDLLELDSVVEIIPISEDIDGGVSLKLYTE